MRRAYYLPESDGLEYIKERLSGNGHLFNFLRKSLFARALYRRTGPWKRYFTKHNFQLRE